MPKRTLRPRKKKTTPKLSTKPYKSISDILLATEAPKAKTAIPARKMKKRVLKKATKKAPAYKIPKTPKESGIGWGP